MFFLIKHHTIDNLIQKRIIKQMSIPHNRQYFTFFISHIWRKRHYSHYDALKSITNHNSRKNTQILELGSKILRSLQCFYKTSSNILWSLQCFYKTSGFLQYTDTCSLNLAVPSKGGHMSDEHQTSLRSCLSEF